MSITDRAHQLRLDAVNLPREDEAKVFAMLLVADAIAEQTAAIATANGVGGEKDLGWAEVELMGHRRVAGQLTDVWLAGRHFIRIVEPTGFEMPDRTHYYSPGSVYGIHPTTEEDVRSRLPGDPNAVREDDRDLLDLPF